MSTALSWGMKWTAGYRGVSAMQFALAIVLLMTLNLWGGEKAKKDGRIRLLKGTILGAAFFGIIMGGPDCFVDGAFQLSGLLEVIAMSAFWGLMFYWPMRWMIDRSEKAADKAVAAAEEAAGNEE